MRVPHAFYRGSRPVLPPVGRRRIQCFLLALPVVLSVYLFTVGDSGFYQIWLRETQIAELAREIARIKAENARLQEAAVRLEVDLTEIERIAREQYGMVKPKEAVYMVYPQAPDSDQKDTP